METSVFVSYSRREAPFVNDLVAKIEQSGYKTWLDYQSLIPGRVWQQQILEAISCADIFLLVVSKESIASKNVKLEWQEAIAKQKRIILIIFEAVKLPAELKDKEWIDFRKSFNQALETLLKTLTAPASQSSLPPEHGFEAPTIVWVSFFIALILSILSITTLWTFYLPYHLFPLPYRVLKRDFNFAHVQGATLMLPFFVFWSMAVYTASSQFSNNILSLDPLSYFLAVCIVASIPASALFLLLVRTSAMQRWGKPVATGSKLRNWYKASTQEKESVTYFLDYASQDTRYALSVMNILKKDGHRQADSEHDADVALVLISRFKKTSNLNPEEKLVYPILLQETSSIDPRLQLIQWVDFRRGIRRIKQFSSLIGNPTMMLKALGVVPSSRQTALPIVIQGIDYSLTFLSMIIFGGVLFASVLDVHDIFSGYYLGRLVATLIFLLVIDDIRRDIVYREGRTICSTRTLLLSMFTVSMIVSIIASVSLKLHGISPENNYESLEQGFALSAGFSMTFMLSCYVSVGLAFVLILIYWRDLKRWIPFREYQGAAYTLKQYFTRVLVILLISSCILFLPIILFPPV